MEPILQSIFDSAVDGIIVIDAKGLIKAFNPAAERLFGYRRRRGARAERQAADAQPRPRAARPLPRATTSKPAIPRIIGTGREVRAAGRTAPRFRCICRSGEMELDGEPAFTGILHDLSRRVDIEEALRKSEERLRSIVESAVDGIIVIDDRGRIQAFNPSAERLFGYTRQRSARTQRQHADAESRSRAARRLSPALPHDRRAEDHRHRPRSDRPAEGRHDVSRASVGRRDGRATASAASRASFTI